MQQLHDRVNAFEYCFVALTKNDARPFNRTLKMNKEPLIIFDTTLRDGEQSPGASMTKEEKVRIAQMLELMKVDVIEAGFPIASEGDFESVKAVADLIKDSRVCALSRALEPDIERAAEALKHCNAGRIHTFIATSPLHMENKLCMTPDQVVEQAVFAVKKARNLIDDVEFSCEDAGRSDFDFLCRVIEAVIDAGARTINIPDTVGYQIPHLFSDTIKRLIESIPNADKAIFSVHCHDDLGVSVANSLLSVLAGARQVECTINGLGERAGNASLEEIVMAIRTRPDVFNVSTRIDTQHIVPTSRLVSNVTGFTVQPNKAIVGANAFSHESGIHQDGVLKHRETYEIMCAQDVGWSNNKIVLGKHSGRNAFRTRLIDLGIELESEEALNNAFKRFKALADRKHKIHDEDLQLLMIESFAKVEAKDCFHLLSSKVCSEYGETPCADVCIRVHDEEVSASAMGDGPVDAVFRAIKEATGMSPHLHLYSVNNISTGTDAQGEVTVRLQDQKNRIVHGHGTHTDIVIASAKAYLDGFESIDFWP